MEDFFNYQKDPNCLNIISIDLSHFNASLVNSANNMFYGCSSLEYLDISNFRPINLINQSNAFYGVDNITYINLYNLHKNLRQEINSTTNLNKKDHLSICKNRNIINNKNAINVCCDISKSPLKCDSNGYIIVKYKTNTEYNSGFNIDSCISRNEISFIVNQDSILKNNDKLIIEKNGTIEIHLHLL
jgi:hypothetical protein